MDAVEDAVVVMPEPVFLFDSFECFGGIRLGCMGLGTVNAVGKDSRELLIADSVGMKPEVVKGTLALAMMAAVGVKRSTNVSE